MRFEFEWGITPASDDGMVEVHERLAGTDLINRYPMHKRIAESFVKARRAFVNRTITSRTAAVQIFEPRPNLEALRLFQKKGHLDS